MPKETEPCRGSVLNNAARSPWGVLEREDKGVTKRWMAGLLSALCVLSACVGLAAPELRVRQGGNGFAVLAMEEESIRWWNSEDDGQYYLFLPAAADAGTLEVHCAAEVRLDGEVVPPGGTTDAFAPGVEVPVQVGENSYSVRVMQSAKIPAMFIHTENGSLEAIHADRNHRETGEMRLVDADGIEIYDGALRQLKGRGNATFEYPKKSFQLKLEDKADLLGMGKARTWVLLANYGDYSLLRNRLTYDLARAAGLAYTPEGRNVDLYVDGEYRGNYLLAEKVEIDPERVDIFDLEEATEAANERPLAEYAAYGSKKSRENTEKGHQIPNNPPDITGGYLLELDYPVRYGREASGFVTRRGQSVVIKSPEFASEAQVGYIRSLMQGLETALRAEDGIDPRSGKHYTDIVDLDSFVRKYLVEEVVKNYDGNKSSLYFYKPADAVSTKLFAGPVWDYDSSLGNFAKDHNPQFASPTIVDIGTDTAKKSYLFPAAYRRPDFYQEAVRTYHQVFVPILETLLGEGAGDGDLRSIDQMAAELEASAAMNQARWPIFIRGSHPVDTGDTFQENIEYLKDFIAGRTAFLSETWSMQ